MRNIVQRQRKIEASLTISLPLLPGEEALIQIMITLSRQAIHPNICRNPGKPKMARQTNLLENRLLILNQSAKKARRRKNQGICAFVQKETLLFNIAMSQSPKDFLWSPTSNAHKVEIHHLQTNN